MQVGGRTRVKLGGNACSILLRLAGLMCRHQSFCSLGLCVYASAPTMACSCHTFLQLLSSCWASAARWLPTFTGEAVEGIMADEGCCPKGAGTACLAVSMGWQKLLLKAQTAGWLGWAQS